MVTTEYSVWLGLHIFGHTLRGTNGVGSHQNGSNLAADSLGKRATAQWTQTPADATLPHRVLLHPLVARVSWAQHQNCATDIDETKQTIIASSMAAHRTKRHQLC